MTGRSRGAPDPVGPSNPNPGHRQVFPDLGAVRRSDAVLDALAARRAGHPIDDEDPAARLLRALIADIDGDTTPSLCGSGSGSGSGSGGQGQGGGHHPQPRRRGPRTIVALSVVGAVLTSTGVAAAGAGLVEQLMPGQSAQEKASEAADAYQSSRDELTTARQALARGNYDSARDSLDRARRGRSDLSGTQALDLDRQIRDLEKDLDELLPDVGAKPRPQPDPGRPEPGPTPRPRKPAPGGEGPENQTPFPRTDGPAAPGVPAPGLPAPSAPDPDGSVERRKEEIRKRTRERIEQYRDWRER